MGGSHQGWQPHQGKRPPLSRSKLRSHKDIVSAGGATPPCGSDLQIANGGSHLGRRPHKVSGFRLRAASCAPTKILPTSVGTPSRSKLRSHKDTASAGGAAAPLRAASCAPT